jgi:hypothetical protein
MMTRPPVDPPPSSIQPTVSPAAREQAIAVLTERFANDHLTLEEFERRTAAAYAATTPAALAELTADLGVAAVPGTRSSMPSMHVGVLLGSVVKKMDRVPRHLSVRSALGNIELDLTQAIFPPGVTEIELRAFMGNIEIQLPKDVGVEDHVSTVLGSFEYRRHPRASSWVESSGIASVVRFTGKVTMSSAEVVIRRDSGEFRSVDDDA